MSTCPYPCWLSTYPTSLPLIPLARRLISASRWIPRETERSPHIMVCALPQPAPAASASQLPRPSSSREKDKPPQPAQSRRDCTAPSWLCCCNPARVPWSFLSHASVRLSWAESEPVQHQKSGDLAHRCTSASSSGGARIAPYPRHAMTVPSLTCAPHLCSSVARLPLTTFSRPSQDRSSRCLDGCSRGWVQSPAPT